MRNLARWVSIIFHPFMMVGVMVGTAASARQTRGEAVRSVAIVALLTIAPLTVLMIRQVRRGVWENADASNRLERPLLYSVCAVALVMLLAYLVVFRPQSFMMRGVLTTLGMLTVCAAVTRWIKVSLHMAFGVLAGVSLALMNSSLGYVIVLGMPALVWSRLTLSRHTPLELALGSIAGLAAGIALHYL